MKTLLTLLVLICVASCAFSQTPVSIGANIGLDVANLNFSPSAPYSLSARTTFTGGGLVEIGLSDVLFLQPELLYVMSGTSFTMTVLDVPVDVTMEYNYIEVPILLKAKLGNSIAKPYLFAGPAFGICTSAQVEGEAEGTSASTDIKDQTESMNVSIDFGGGVEYPLNSITSIFGDVRYSLGLTNIDKTSGDTGTEKTTGIEILAGVKFHL
jgi:opacity protein-like surface antigen